MQRISIVVAVCLILSGCTQQNGESEAIGMILPLSGPYGSFGEEIREGASLFAEQHPDAVFIYEDDKFDPKQSLSAYRKLRDTQDVSLFVGPVLVANVHAVYGSMNAEDREESVLIAIDYCRTEHKEMLNVVCTYPSLEQQVANGLTFASQKNARSMYVVVDESAIGEQFLQAIYSQASKHNISIRGETTIAANEQNLYVVATKIREANADIVYVAVPTPHNVNLMRRLREQSNDGIVFFAYDVDPQLLNEFSSVLEGVALPGSPSIHYAPEFEEAFISKYSKKPSHYNAYGYEFAAASYYAARSGNKNREAIEEEISRQDFAFINMRFDDHETILPLYVKHIVNGSVIIS